MNNLGKTLMALGLAALLAAPASAQERRRGPGGPGGPGGGMMGGGRGIGALLTNRGVQEELKLDDAQKVKIGEIAETVREKAEAARGSLESLEGQARFAKMRELSKEADATTLKALADVLKPEQVARLKGIHYQSQGISAFEDEDLQKALGLTADQKSTVAKVIADSNAAMRQAFGGDREAGMAKMQELRKESLAKVEASLTAEQKAEYAKLIGAPFELRFEGRGPGGPGGPRGRNR